MPTLPDIVGVLGVIVMEYVFVTVIPVTGATACIVTLYAPLAPRVPE